MFTCGEWLAQSTQQLSSVAHASQPIRLNLELCLARELGCTRTHLIAYPEQPLTDDITTRANAAAALLRDGVPLAYILGHCEFWSRRYTVGPEVLVPRPETELLVETTLQYISDTASSPSHILELGTGSGCVAVTLALETDESTQVTATDICSKALTIASQNAREHNASVNFVCGDWFSAVGGRFDYIVSNPPYIASAHPALAQLTHEPKRALASGPRGMDALSQIILAAPDHLTPNGRLLLEHGFDQSPAVARLLDAAGLQQIKTHNDLAGIPRVTSGQWCSD